MDVILFGPPGAGKGTHADLIATDLSIPHMSTGNIFRWHIKNKTELGNTVVDFTKNGQLVPDDIVFKVVASKLVDSEYANGVLYDGFPRTIPQADMLVEWLEKNNRKLKGIFNISVSDEEVRKRLVNRRTCLDCGQSFHRIFKPCAIEGVCDSCGGNNVVQRADDHIDKVNARLKEYHASTQPILNHLSQTTKTIHIDGEGAIDSIKSNIKLKLRELSR